jgi:3-hydroxyisobutyrate dehydrogenase-like beta-hydroxyacid dehydrogenase
MRAEPLFQIDLALKDCRHMLQLAEGSGTVMGNLHVVRQHLEAVKAEQGEKGDFAAVYGAVRKESGLPFDHRDRSG